MKLLIKFQTLFILAIFAINSFALSGNEVITYAGSALTKQKGNFFYKETHAEIIKENKHLRSDIVYHDSKGKKIGYKTLDFSTSLISPAYILEDERANYREGAEFKNNEVKVYYQFTNKDKVPVQKSIFVPQPIVIDGGFNYFVKQNWQKLMEGKILTFNFVSPSKLDYFTLRISKKEDLIFEGKKASLIYLELDNIILRWLLTPIKITYDNLTKRILKYEGIANLSDSNGKNETVTLTFPTLGP